MIIFIPNGPITLSEQNYYLFGILTKFSNNNINYYQNKMGLVSVYPNPKGVFIKGFVSNLNPGMSYSILILENSNFLLNSTLNKISYHFNPTKATKHNCLKEDLASTKNYNHHLGDLGNVIANSNGVAEINLIIENLNLNLLFGRPFVVLNQADDCDQDKIFVKKEEILYFSILSLYSENPNEEKMAEIERENSVFIGAKDLSNFNENTKIKDSNDLNLNVKDNSIKNKESNSIKENGNLRTLKQNDIKKNLKDNTKEITPDKKNSKIEKEKNYENPVMKKKELPKVKKIVDDNVDKLPIALNNNLETPIMKKNVIKKPISINDDDNQFPLYNNLFNDNLSEQKLPENENDNMEIPFINGKTQKNNNLEKQNLQNPFLNMIQNVPSETNLKNNEDQEINTDPFMEIKKNNDNNDYDPNPYLQNEEPNQDDFENNENESKDKDSQFENPIFVRNNDNIDYPMESFLENFSKKQNNDNPKNILNNLDSQNNNMNSKNIFNLSPKFKQKFNPIEILENKKNEMNKNKNDISIFNNSKKIENRDPIDIIMDEEKKLKKENEEKLNKINFERNNEKNDSKKDPIDMIIDEEKKLDKENEKEKFDEINEKNNINEQKKDPIDMIIDEEKKLDKENEKEKNDVANEQKKDPIDLIIDEQKRLEKENSKQNKEKLDNFNPLEIIMNDENNKIKNENNPLNSKENNFLNFMKNPIFDTFQMYEPKKIERTNPFDFLMKNEDNKNSNSKPNSNFDFNPIQNLLMPKKNNEMFKNSNEFENEKQKFAQDLLINNSNNDLNKLIPKNKEKNSELNDFISKQFLNPKEEDHEKQINLEEKNPFVLENDYPNNQGNEFKDDDYYEQDNDFNDKDDFPDEDEEKGIKENDNDNEKNDFYNDVHNKNSDFLPFGNFKNDNFLNLPLFEQNDKQLNKNKKNKNKKKNKKNNEIKELSKKMEDSIKNDLEKKLHIMDKF